MLTSCNLCFKRILSHSPILQCCACHDKCHVACLSGNISKYDPLYVKKQTNKWICTKCIEGSLPFVQIQDDNEFLKVVNSLDEGLVYETEDLCMNVLNPLNIGECGVDVPLDEIDPDIQYLNDSCFVKNFGNSNYYKEDMFNGNYAQMTNNNDYFSIIHMNIRSVPKHLDDFTQYLTNLQHSFRIIGLTETWLKEDNSFMGNINGYNCEYTCRHNRTGGGVSMYVQSGLLYKRRRNLEMSQDGTESVVLELDKQQIKLSKNVLIAVIYRPPNKDIASFNKELDDLLSITKKEQKFMYIMGDFNINLLNVDNHTASADFLQCMYSYAFLPLINKPTRVTETSSTLIDNIFCNVANEMDIFKGILLTGISDHFPIFCVNLNIACKVKAQYVRKRIYSDTNISAFLTTLHDTSWEAVLTDNNCQKSFSTFYQKLCDLYKQCFPYNNIKIGYKNRKSWLTAALKTSIKRKNKLYLRSIVSPSPENKAMYKQFRNKLHSLMRRAEREHYDSMFQKNKNNMKRTWGVMKEIINKTRDRKSTDSFIVKGNKISDEGEIADAFNKFYINVGLTLAKKIPSNRRDPTSYIKQVNKSSIFLEPTDKTEISNIVKLLNDSSAGYDDITAKIIKTSNQYLLEPLTHVFNLSLSQGVFPDELKIAKVVPIYKKDDEQLITNYRPVSVLPVLSKVLERLMYTRITKFLTKHNTLYSYQFGFRRNHGPNLALITLIDKIVTCKDNGDFMLGIFLDFSKAFDTVNHQILLDKLNKYGINGIAHNWLTSYLNKRKQYVTYQKVNSSTLNISCGVPQGSILGPLLFLLYVNDIVNAVQTLFPILFADDTSIFTSGKDINVLAKRINIELASLVEWLQVNKLSLNISKTNYMIFRPARKIPHLTEPIIINNVPIARVSSTRFLGVMLDEKCDWCDHVKYIKNKISKVLGIFIKARRVLNVSSLIKLYYAFVYPYLTYCIEVWGAAKASDLNSIHKIQKRVLRIITFSSYSSSTIALFKRFKILRVNEIYNYMTLIFMFKFNSYQLPSIFTNMFECNRNVYPTRSKNKLHIPIGRTASVYKIVRFLGVSLWNRLPQDIRFSNSLSIFKRKLMNKLLDMDLS